jgi:hypothetical protein
MKKLENTTRPHKRKLLTPSKWLSKRYTYEKYGNKVPIDIKIAGLISNAWGLGINTLSCCEQTFNPFLPKAIRKDDRVWILFTSLSDAKKFNDYTSPYDKKWFRLSKGNLNEKVDMYFPTKDIKKVSALLKKNIKKKVK